MSEMAWWVASALVGGCGGWYLWGRAYTRGMLAGVRWMVRLLASAALVSRPMPGVVGREYARGWLAAHRAVVDVLVDAGLYDVLPELPQLPTLDPPEQDVEWRGWN